MTNPNPYPKPNPNLNPNPSPSPNPNPNQEEEKEMEEIGAVIEVVGRAQKGKDLWYEIKKNGRGANETKSVPLSEIETMYMP